MHTTSSGTSFMTTDATAAQGFYSKVVGWKPQDAAQPGMDYTLRLAGDAPMRA